MSFTNKDDLIEGRRREFLQDKNFHLKKYPHLQDCEVVKVDVNSKSVLDLSGVRIVDKEKKIPFFVCLLGDCYRDRTVVKLSKTSTSNGTIHVNHKNNVKSSKTEAYQRNLATIAKHIEAADPLFRVDPTRWFEVNLSAFAVQHSLSYRAFESDTWKVIASKLPVGTNNKLKNINIRKHNVEHYVSIKKTIVSNIQSARSTFEIPFMSLSLDLIQNEVQNKKLIGIRVSCVHKGEMMSYNLAVRGYNPSTRQMDSDVPASECLMQWCTQILAEFNIEPKRDILTSCSDSGSDVKRALEKVFPTHREWCISHLTHLALADAFGSSLDPSRSQNTEVRDVITKCRRVIESINKSKSLKHTYEQKCSKELGKTLKVRNSPTHRWSSTDDVLARILRVWDHIVFTFNHHRTVLPIAGERQLILELRSVIHQVRNIQAMAQRTEVFCAIPVYVLMIDLYFKLLDDTKPLKLYDPAVTNDSASPHSEHVERPAAELNSKTNTVRQKLKAALFERFYKRYHPLKAYRKASDFYPKRRGIQPKVQAERKDFNFSYLLDMQALFHPKLSNCQLMKMMIFSFNDVSLEFRQRHFDTVKAYLWHTIKQLAEQVAYYIVHQIKTSSNEEVVQVEESISPHIAKKQKVKDPIMDILDKMILPVSTLATEQVTEVCPKQLVDDEIKYYLEITDFPEFEDTISWWSKRTNREQMPCLTQVALAVLACKPSSGGLECDFGLLKDVLAPKRASLGQGFVEVEMMLKLNKHLLLSQPSAVETLPADKWREYIPQRPTFDFDEEDSDTEYLGALDSIDDDGSIASALEMIANNNDGSDDDPMDSDGAADEVSPSVGVAISQELPLVE
jgi:hypothetical protein